MLLYKDEKQPYQSNNYGERLVIDADKKFAINRELSIILVILNTTFLYPNVSSNSVGGHL